MGLDESTACWCLRHINHSASFRLTAPLPCSPSPRVWLVQTWVTPLSSVWSDPGARQQNDLTGTELAGADRIPNCLQYVFKPVDGNRNSQFILGRKLITCSALRYDGLQPVP